MSPLQLACLQFCIELLDQGYHESPYECALVCVLGALSYNCDGWLKPQLYHSIVCRVHRIAQGLVLHYTLLLGSDAKEILRGISARVTSRAVMEDVVELPEMKDCSTVRSHWEWLHDWVEHKMLASTKTPIGWMIMMSVKLGLLNAKGKS